MDVQDMTALIAAMLNDEIEGEVSVNGSTVCVTFADGTVRTVTVA